MNPTAVKHAITSNPVDHPHNHAKDLDKRQVIIYHHSDLWAPSSSLEPRHRTPIHFTRL